MMIEPSPEWPDRKIVAELYNDRHDFRCRIFERGNGSYSYFFEFLMDVSDEPVSPIPEIWTDMNLTNTSGVSSTIESAIEEAKRDSIWLQRGQLT